MTPLLYNFCQEDVGQDLVEYALLLAFVLFCTVALVGFGSSSIKGIVSTSTSQIVAGSEFANGG